MDLAGAVPGGPEKNSRLESAPIRKEQSHGPDRAGSGTREPGPVRKVVQESRAGKVGPEWEHGKKR